MTGILVLILDNGYSHKQCVDECIAIIINRSNYCIENPFAKTDYIVNDESLISLPECGNNGNNGRKLFERNICVNQCHIDCNQEYYYYEPNYLYTGVYSIFGDSTLWIKYKYSIDFEYMAEPEILFLIMLSNICGLFSLWFGLSFIDLTEFLRKIVLQIKAKLISILTMLISKFIRTLSNISKYRFLKNFAQKLSSILQKFRKFINYVKRLKFRLLIKFISILLIIYQSYLILDEYYQYFTKVSIKLGEHHDSNGRIMLDTLPTTSVCHKFNYEEMRLMNYTKYPAELENVERLIELRFNKMRDEGNWLFEHMLDIWYKYLEVDKDVNIDQIKNRHGKLYSARNQEKTDYFLMKFLTIISRTLKA